MSTLVTLPRGSTPRLPHCCIWCFARDPDSDVSISAGYSWGGGLVGALSEILTRITVRMPICGRHRALFLADRYLRVAVLVLLVAASIVVLSGGLRPALMASRLVWVVALLAGAGAFWVLEAAYPRRVAMILSRTCVAFRFGSAAYAREFCEVNGDATFDAG